MGSIPKNPYTEKCKMEFIEYWSATLKACHCEERSDVAIRNPLRCSASRGFLSRKRTDSQEVNCPKGAREATLECASVRTGSE